MCLYREAGKVATAVVQAREVEAQITSDSLMGWEEFVVLFKVP